MIVGADARMNRKELGRTMQFLKCACYLAGLGILSFVLGRLVPKTWFDYTRFPYRTFAFERNGKLYEALRVSRWQSRVPDMSRLFPKLTVSRRMFFSKTFTLHPDRIYQFYQL